MKSALYLLLTVAYAQENMLAFAERFRQLQESVPCKSPSPYTKMIYKDPKVHEVRGVFFCDQYARRTCCSEDNFNDIKKNWFKTYTQSVNLTPQCQEAFQKIICYDCDGDVGQRVRRGICPSLCTLLYKACQFDYFQFEDKKLRFCKKTDLFCSELRYIHEDDGSDFCRSLGYEVNPNDNVDEWFEDLLTNSSLFKPMCWDSTPSQRIFGPAFSLDASAFEGMREKLKKPVTGNWNTLLILSVAALLVLGLLIIVLIRKV